MKLIDVLNEQTPNFRYKWKEQPEWRGKAPSQQRAQTRSELGIQEPPKDQDRSVNFTPSPEHRGARPADRRSQQPTQQQAKPEPETAEQIPSSSEDLQAAVANMQFSGEQAKLGDQIFQFARRLWDKSEEFARFERIIQQEAQRRKSQGPGLVPKEQQGA